MKRALALSSFLSFLACGPTTAPCNASTCAGCCDLDGACQQGSMPTACGSAGGQCVACLFGQQCVAGFCQQAPPTCTPKTCQQLGKNCGQIDDGCGKVLECGVCGMGQACGAGGIPNVCAAGTCTPKTCLQLSAECGRASDGCGLLLDCGACMGSSTCTAQNRCTACVPTTCAAQSRNCGSIGDGCGGMLQCGTCSTPGDTCGGGGTANVCGQGACTPTTCAAQNKNCGSISDNCGGMLQCGTCSGALTCGGGGVANVCGATCAVTCPTGFTCDQLGQCSGGNLGGLVLNEVGYPVSGAITVNGAAPTKDATYCGQSGNLNDQIAVISYTEPTKGYSGSYSIRCSATNWTFNLVLPPGTYDFRVAQGGYSGAAGVNLLPVSYAAAQGVVVNGPVTNLALNEVGYAVSGSVTVNGAAPTRDATYCGQSGNLNDQIGVISYTEPTKGYSGSYSFRCSSSGWSFSLMLPPGTYDFRVAQGSYSGAAGVNLLGVNYLAAQGVVVNGPVANLALAEIGVQVSGAVTVNGAAPTKDAVYCAQSGNLNDQIGVINYTEPTKGYSGSYSFRCSAANWNFNLVLPPGTYDFRVSQGGYSGAAGVNLLPVAYQAAQGVVVASAPVNNLMLNEVGYAVSGRVTVNGAAPTKDATYCAQSGNLNDQIGVISYTEATKGYSGSYAFRCSSANWNFALTLPPGTYSFRVAQGSYSVAAGVNLLGVNYLAAQNVTVNGPVTNLALDEVGYAVSGSVTVNGAAPTKDATYCSQSGNLNDQIGVLSYSDSTRGYSGTYSFRCNSTNWTFALTLPPGTYEFRMAQGGYSVAAGVNLLPVNYLAAQNVMVSAPVSNLAIAEVGRTVAGSITVNGQAPTKSTTYCSQSGNLNDQIGMLSYSDASRGYSGSYSWRCSSTNWNFSLTLPPGVYDFRLSQGAYSSAAGVNLLGVSYLAASRVVVP